MIRHLVYRVRYTVADGRHKPMKMVLAESEEQAGMAVLAEAGEGAMLTAVEPQYAIDIDATGRK